MRFWNKYTLIGTCLIILGIPLSVVWIGIPLMVIGFLIGDFGIIYWFVKKIPGLDEKISKLGKIIKKSYDPYFRKKVTQ